MDKVLFSEEQRFTQWWLYLIVSISLLTILTPFVYGIYSQEVLDEPFGDNPMSTEGLIVTGFFSVLFTAFIFFVVLRSKLKTKITTVGISVCFPPLIRKWKNFVPEEIEKFEVRKVRIKREFGGYGIRRRRKHGTAYTVSGNIGLQLIFKNGKRLLIGTQKKQAIEYAMEKLMESENPD